MKLGWGVCESVLHDGVQADGGHGTVLTGRTGGGTSPLCTHGLKKKVAHARYAAVPSAHALVGLPGVGHSPAVHWPSQLPATTSFPQVVTTAASFNTSLFAAIGAAIGLEGRAKAK